MITVTLRLRPRDAILVASGAALAYTAMMIALDQFVTHAVETLILACYAVLTAIACAVIARERLRQLAAQLELGDLMQQVGQIGTWEWSIEDNSVTWSSQLRRIFEIPQDIVLTPESLYERVHPDDLTLTRDAMETAVAERSDFCVDHRIITTSGKVRWLHCRARVVVRSDGSARKVVGSSQDITETKRMQEQLLVGRKLASLGTLASGVAHEINNPLAYVATSLALLRRRLETGVADPQARSSLYAALDAAQDGCQRVAEIVRGLKVFSRADDAGTGPVELARVADSAIAMAAHEIGQRAKLVREYASTARVAGNESRLLQVVLNLIVNAAQAIETGSRADHEIRVRIADAGRGWARLSVADTGCGIPDEHLPRIFDPFFTRKPVGEGTGLGLSISHGIVSGHGGRIEVESRPGEGTCFRVYLPLQPAPARAGARA